MTALAVVFTVRMEKVIRKKDDLDTMTLQNKVMDPIKRRQLLLWLVKQTIQSTQ